jgi:hypothetical protein
VEHPHGGDDPVDLACRTPHRRVGDRLYLGGKLPGYWVHLRVCQECDHVGCCDPGRHATAHFRSAGHLVIR